MTAKSITHCRKGHDITLPGALDEYTVGKMRCAECRRITDRKRKQLVSRTRKACLHGHLYTEQSSRLVTRGETTYRLCVTCQRESDGYRRSLKTSGRKSESEETQNADLTRQLLDLYAAREREPRADLKAEITLQLAAITNTSARAGRSRSATSHATSAG